MASILATEEMPRAGKGAVNFWLPPRGMAVGATLAAPLVSPVLGAAAGAGGG